MSNSLNTFSNDLEGYLLSLQTSTLASARALVHATRAELAHEFEQQHAELIAENARLASELTSMQQSLAAAGRLVARREQQLERLADRVGVTGTSATTIGTLHRAISSWHQEIVISRRDRAAERLWERRRRAALLARTLRGWRVGAAESQAERAQAECDRLQTVETELAATQAQCAELRAQLGAAQRAREVAEMQANETTARMRAAVLQSVSALNAATPGGTTDRTFGSALLATGVPPQPPLPLPSVLPLSAPPLTFPQPQAEAEAEADVDLSVMPAEEVRGALPSARESIQDASYLAVESVETPLTHNNVTLDYPQAAIADDEQHRQYQHLSRMGTIHAAQPEQSAWVAPELAAVQTIIAKPAQDADSRRTIAALRVLQRNEELTGAEAVQLARSQVPRGRHVNVAAAIMRDINYGERSQSRPRPASRPPPRPAPTSRSELSGTLNQGRRGSMGGGLPARGTARSTLY